MSCRDRNRGTPLPKHGPKVVGLSCRANQMLNQCPPHFRESILGF
jgi:hypothetical protein